MVETGFQIIALTRNFKQKTMQKVTGIGGVFIKAKDAEALAAWYQKHLGIEFGGQVYFDFRWVNHNTPRQTGIPLFHFLKRTANIFSLLKNLS